MIYLLFVFLGTVAESEDSLALSGRIGKWLYHVSPALLAVILGAFGVNRFFIRRANAAAFADRICEDLKILASDLLEYWSFDSSDQSSYRRNQILAQKIKGALQAVDRDIRCFSSKYQKRKSSEFQLLMVDLVDAATGGDFESDNIDFRPEKYIKIAKRIGEIRSKLLETKI
ncbi:hypothetical protein [Luteolibacter marinus]|uniref:hypothetical protein n=1 Tax=Luteolibacter marinus TaxID=2776705 RepID=UPI0018691F37|nr:hypothetical protein [Luteolibacter marinus]